MHDLIQQILAQVQQGSLSKVAALKQIRDFRTKGLLPAPVKNGVGHSPAAESANPFLKGATKLIPVWDVVKPGESSAFPENGIVVIGANPSDLAAIQNRCPSARRVEADSAEELLIKLRTAGEVKHLVWFASEATTDSCHDDRLLADQQSGVLRAFRFVKALLESGYGAKTLNWTVVTRNAQLVAGDELIDPTHAAIAAFFGSLTKEQSSWKSRILDFTKEQHLSTAIDSLPGVDQGGTSWSMRNGQWFRQRFVPARFAMDWRNRTERTAIRQGGVYVIIGGAGGVGSVWTGYLIRQYQARVIWIGRRAVTPEIEADLDALAAIGPKPEYLSADAGDLNSLAKVAREIRSRHGAIHGVVHSAIVLSDQSVRNMTEEQFSGSFFAKASVSLRLAQVFVSESPDFILFFSSMMSQVQPAGQSNYVAGSAFNDAFAHRLSRELSCRVKVMNWGYWGGTGVVATDVHKERMARAGLGSIEPAEAMEALEELLASPVNQMALLRFNDAKAAEQMGLGAEWIDILPQAASSQGASIQQQLPDFESHIDTVRASKRDDRTRELDAWFARLLRAQLISMGAFNAGDSQSGTDQVASRIGLDGGYIRWLDATLNVFGAYGITERIEPVTEWAAWESAREFWLRNPNTQAQVMLAETALRSLPAVLTGKRPATDVLFPGSSMRLVEGIYKNNLASDFFNEALAEAAIAGIKQRLEADPSAKIRILEIGAGTGGTTATVLHKLEPFGTQIQEYCYTDLSNAFARHAKDAFGAAHPYLKFQIFDVTRPLAPQGMPVGEFDLVIATNVLHATPNIRVALRNAKSALRSDGLLLVNEFVENSVFTHVTFGLLAGWWLYEDGAVRLAGSPGLSLENWLSVLRGEGFQNCFLPLEAARDLGQQVFVAQSNGVVRQDNTAAVSKPKQIIKETAPKATTRVNANDISLEDLVRDSLVAKLGESLKIQADQIDFEMPFAEFGVDSITGVRFVDAVNAALGIEINTTNLFDHSTVNKLVAHIVSRHGDRLQLQPPIPTVGSPMFEIVPALTPASTRAVTQGPIAIIGISGRFAQSRTPEELWQHLANGDDLVGESSRWDLAAIVKDALGEGAGRCHWGSFLDGIDEFDPMFFNISGVEATHMDPQQRLFLMEAWRALEDAGYAGKGVQGCDCGVYVGHNSSDYKELFGNSLPPQAMWGNSSSVIPARISYYLDLHGPAVAVDTACSSSLVAVHLACQGLWGGETQMALAGGVFVQSTPLFYLAANRAAMLSPTGRCHTFDQNADGFVPGEGVGVVVLKRLEDALRDGDSIYGLIRGSAINQDGATNGVTAPSAESQERLERQVYEKFQVHPEQIQLVEAHGTGTKLGDPIEFEALTRAFRKDTARKAYCAIGSIKTNIGHTTAAAGVAGLLKLILALKHRQIPPSLHFASGNRAIHFEDTPFYVNTRLQAWDTPAGTPRRAAISAFGFSGTNAHMVIEEAPLFARVANSQPASLIVLTAGTAGQLRQMAMELSERVEKDLGLSVADISFTLLIGRRHLDHRFACVVRDRNELLSALNGWINGERSVSVFAGQLTQPNVREQATLKASGNESIERCRNATDAVRFTQALSTIADLFVQGYKLNYAGLFEGRPFHRVSLPTYPFAREKYWVEGAADRLNALLGRQVKSVEAIAPVLHPLLHRNISDLSDLRFASTFTGREFFLADHIVQGRRVFPAAAYLELARDAGEQAWSGVRKPGEAICLKNVAWYAPFEGSDEPVELQIALDPIEAGVSAFRVYSQIAGEAGTTIHSRGSLELCELPVAARLDLVALRAECSQAHLTAAECYAAFKAAGLNYGPGHQSLETVHIGRSGLLSRITLPSSLRAEADKFVLHPSLIDGALQSIVGFGVALMSEAGNSSSRWRSEPRLIVPFALDEVQIHRACPSSMWVHTRYTQGGIDDSVAKVDIDLCDDEGNVCVHLRGLTTRQFTAAAQSQSEGETLPFAPEWIAGPVLNRASSDEYVQRLIILCEPNPATAKAVTEAFPRARVVVFPESRAGIDQRFEPTAALLLSELQQLLNERNAGNALVQVLFTNEGDQAIYAGLAGMLRTARLEEPRLVVQVIGVARDCSADVLVKRLVESGTMPGEIEIDYSGGERRVASWREVLKTAEPETLPWKAGGTYLVTGGGGGLGLLLADEIVRTVPQASVVLVGRSSANAQLNDRIAGWKRAGVQVTYLCADVSSELVVTDLIRDLQVAHGGLNGIVHAAGIVKDNFLRKKTTAELHQVFAAKVAGLVNLDRATQHLPLDFVVVFSAVAGALGNIGQADYAAANRFTDHFIDYRNRLVAEGKRQGQGFAINWPLWREGGMRVSQAAEAGMRTAAGMIPLGTTEGFATLSRILQNAPGRTLVLHGEGTRLREVVHAIAATTQVGSPVVPVIASDDLAEDAIRYLRGLLAAEVKLPLERIQADVSFDKYGLDSLMVMNLNTALEKSFGSLSKTLFFEYQTVRELAGFLVAHHTAKLASMVQTAGVVTPAVPVQSENRTIAMVPKPELAKSIPQKSDERTEIAIVGLSGRYPQADSLEAFWANLRAGKDCIVEVPAERWDHSLYFDANREARGKTYAKWGGFIDGADRFDPAFFNISPREAAIMDPQERLFLECVYETLQDAGYTRESLRDKSEGETTADVGVYVGVMYEEYQLYGAQETALGRPIALPGNPSSIANRVSYICNFHGPSMAVDTMCSSSLTAIHLACQSLRAGECKAAIAGGVNLSLHPNKYLMLAQGNFASSNGRCESFGRGGDGYVPAEGVGAVLLKQLSDAIADGDHIYAIIKGSAVNHGGKTNGYTVPNPNLQARLVARALQAAKVDARSFSYLEAHGTGTSLGDPIEIAGLSKAFRRSTSDKQFCAIGSVKSNIGHAESAAGIAGVTKVLLQMKHRQLVPSLHSRTLNPNIDFNETPFVVQQELTEWKRPILEVDGTRRELPRIAGISSFGAGGSYAHVILQEWEQSPAANDAAIPPALIVLSARNEKQLKATVERMIGWLAANPSADLCQVAGTLQLGREALEERLGCVVSTLSELADKLQRWIGDRSHADEFARGRVDESSAPVVPVTTAEAARSVGHSAELFKLAEQWAQGASIPWSSLYARRLPQKISLPTYPFSRERFWFSALLPAEVRPAASTPAPSIRVQPLEMKVNEPKLSEKPGRISLRPVTAVPRLEALEAKVETVPLVSTAPIPVSKPAADLSRQPMFTAQALLSELTASLAAALFMSSADIQADRSFIDLGLDSIVGVEWIRTVNRQYNTAITATKVYDYPTLRKFAGYLAEELNQRQPAVVAEAVPASQPVVIAPVSVAQRTTLGDRYGLVISNVGSLDEIALQDWSPSAPAADEVTIQVRASAVNFPDTMCVKGLYPTMPDYPFVPGFEVAGVVSAVGASVDEFKVGDEVIALTGRQMGGHASRVNAPVSATVRKPANISFEDACSLPVVFGTVYHAFEVGRLAVTDQLLIQTATGGCGLVAWQLANRVGCVSYGTSSREEKLAILRRLGVAQALNYKTTEFDAELRRLTNGRGVDVVLNMLSGEAIQRGLNCLAPGGRYLELAVHGLKTSPKLDLSRLLQNQSIHSIDLRQLSYQGLNPARERLEAMVSLLESGELVPIVSRIYPIEQIREAFAFVGEGKHIGKVVISHTRKTMEDCTERCIEGLLRQKTHCRNSRPVVAAKPRPALAPVQPVEREAIAVIGMSGEFPKSPNLDAYWSNISSGVDCVTEVPSSRWSVGDYYDPQPKTPGKTYCKWMGALETADQFDSLFFGISPAEAESMDPQQRLFLQNCYACVENAGLRPTSLSGSRCGVFVGCGAGDYGQGGDDDLNAFGLMGGATSILASRISYFLNLKGPCLAIDTACSSSLVAIAQACESLSARTCDLALAGGVYIMTSPSMLIMTSQAGMVSKDGKCYSFDARANGFVPGEGVGVLLLKRLSEAVRDGDSIQGVIRGWGVNQDGKTNGITAPSVTSQANLEREVYDRFNVHPESISLIEAHGTGTNLGDPIEVEALIEAFRHYTSNRAYCALGSVKANIGHLMPAAGVAGAIKVLLALQHRQLPPSIHFETLNPHIPLQDSPFYVTTSRKPWETRGTEPHRAAVSSFGFSGTNAHVVFEEYASAPKARALETAPQSPELILLSAKDQSRLKEYAQRWIDALDSTQPWQIAPLAELAFTLQTGRDALPHRLAVLATDLAGLRHALSQFLQGKTGNDCFHGIVDREGGAGLTETEEGMQFVRELGRNRRWPNLAKLWIAGELIDWEKIHEGRGLRRVTGLPTYPFAPNSYWKRSGVKVVSSTPKPVATELKPALDPLFFEESWQTADLVQAPLAGRQLIACFLSNRELQAAVSAEIKLQNAAASVVFISQEPVLSTNGNGSSHPIYHVDPNLTASYVEALISIRREHGEVTGVFHLWNLENPAALREFSSVMHLVQAIGAGAIAPRRCLIAAPLHDELDRSYAESLIGFERSIGQVLRSTDVAVDIQNADGELDATSAQSWARVLWNEFQAERASSVWMRDGQRLVCKMQPIALTAPTITLRQRGTYLITGGLGGLGMIFANHLARTCKANLILTGRSPLDDTKRGAIKALESRGSSVVYLQADVADAEAMKAGLQSARESLGPIHGVLHIAGGGNYQSILNKSAREFAEVLKPKMEGTRILDELTQSDPLDFVCYFSSSSAVLGDFGACDYAVANRFLAAYASYRNQLCASGQRSGKTVAILWPLWKSGGMGFGDPTVAEAYLKAGGQRYLESTEGIAIFEQLLGQGSAAPLVLVGERQRVQRFLGITQSEPQAAIPIATGDLSARVVNDLKQQVTALLKIPSEQIDVKASFTDYGFDSISLETWARTLSKHYGIEITPTAYYGNPTVERLAAHLIAEYGAKLQPTAEPVIVSEEPKEEPKPALPMLPQSSVFEPIAVIGMSGRFPGASDVRELWRVLESGRSCITEVPAGRWDWRKPFSMAGGDLNAADARWGAFMSDVDCFDPLFFGIAPSEAVGIDPRQRIFLEEAWRTFEDAGYMGARIRGASCGVYVGVEEGEYGLLSGGTTQINGNQNATLAARIAYALDLKGPNFALNAACASGLVALHQACLALRQGDCEMALVGGVNLLVSPLPFTGLKQAGMLSRDGRAAVFDEAATGMVPGEAVAVVLLKPLSNALRDGDQIHGCIRAHGVNYDGKTNGITAPDPNSQAGLLQSVYAKYGITPEQIDFVLAHSVGSRLGDPVEIEAFTKAFARSTPKKQFCHLGSVKPLLGHTFAASGIVNLIAMLLAMKHRTLLGTGPIGKVNSYIHFENSPFTVSPHHQPWPANPGRPRLGALSATGISGANAHVVVEEYAVPSTQAARKETHCVPLSARTLPSLLRAAERLAQFIEADNSVSLADVAHTLQIGRDAMAVRAAFVVDTAEQLIQQLRGFIGAGGGKSISMGGASGSEKALAIATAWTGGADADWKSLDNGGRVISLPTYSFERKRYWVDRIQPETPVQIPAPRVIEAMTAMPGSTTTPLAVGLVEPAIETASFPATTEEQRQHLVQVKAKIRRIIEQVFLMDEDFEDSRPFFEIGMTSMNTAQFVETLNQQFNSALMASDIFDYSTVDRLAAYLATAGSVAPARPMPEPVRAVEVRTPLVSARAYEPAAPAPVNRIDAILQGIADHELGIEDALDCLNPER